MFLLDWPAAVTSVLHRGAAAAPPTVTGVATDAIGELLVAAARGDREAVVALEHRVGGLVRANIRRVLRDASQTDAATEQFFAEVAGDAATFDPAAGDAQAWLLTRAHRHATAGRAEPADTGAPGS